MKKRKLIQRPTWERALRRMARLVAGSAPARSSHPIVQDHQIAALTPSFFTLRTDLPDLDHDVREAFFRIYKPLRDEGLQDYHLSRIASALFYYRPLLRALLKPTETKHVLEIGSGWGLKALSWADLFATYTGIELNSENVERSNAFLKRLGLMNARIISGNAETVLREPESFGIPKIDLLILYAVLEHLTIPERKSILRLAQDVYLRGGYVLLAESPNRLCRQDQHSWQMPFTEWLPDALLQEYALKSEREDLKSKLRAAEPNGVPEMLYRLGRGISFHEFECFWDAEAFENMNVLNDGYSPALLNLYPFMRDEYDLLRFCHGNDLDVHRLFTRYWIEGLLSRSLNEQVSKDALYLPPRQITSGPMNTRRPFWGLRRTGVTAGLISERERYDELDEVVIHSGDAQELRITNPSRIARHAVLLLDIEKSSGTVFVEETHSHTRLSIDLARIAQARLPAWHTQVALPLGSSIGKEYQVRVEGRGSKLVCQGALLV